MCEYRLGEYCFNPRYLKPGFLANHWKDAPCCNGVEVHTDDFVVLRTRFRTVRMTHVAEKRVRKLSRKRK